MTRSETTRKREQEKKEGDLADGGDHDVDEFHMSIFKLVIGGEHDP